MSLTAARATFKQTLLTLAARSDEEQTPEEAIDEFIDAIDAYIKSAQVNVPALGLVAPNGPVTGQAIGTLE